MGERHHIRFSGVIDVEPALELGQKHMPNHPQNLAVVETSGPFNDGKPLVLQRFLPPTLGVSLRRAQFQGLTSLRSTTISSGPMQRPRL